MIAELILCIVLPVTGAISFDMRFFKAKIFIQKK